MRSAMISCEIGLMVNDVLKLCGLGAHNKSSIFYSIRHEQAHQVRVQGSLSNSRKINMRSKRLPSISHINLKEIEPAWKFYFLNIYDKHHLKDFRNMLPQTFLLLQNMIYLVKYHKDSSMIDKPTPPI